MCVHFAAIGAVSDLEFPVIDAKLLIVVIIYVVQLYWSSGVATTVWYLCSETAILSVDM